MKPLATTSSTLGAPRTHRGTLEAKNRGINNPSWYATNPAAAAASSHACPTSAPTSTTHANANR